MSYRIEEKLLINNNSILEFRNYLNSKTAKQIKIIKFFNILDKRTFYQKN